MQRRLPLLALPLCLGSGFRAAADVVATQTLDRASDRAHLLVTDDTMARANADVLLRHDVRVVPVFTDDVLTDVDVVYLSPVRVPTDEQRLTDDEIAVLVRFVNGGGRLVLPADLGEVWSTFMNDVSTEFGVAYGTGIIFNEQRINVTTFENPITDGPHGRVNQFLINSANQGVIVTNPSYVSLATYKGNEVLGFLPADPSAGRFGEVVFLTDVSTFSEVHDIFTEPLWDQADDQTLWRNLFSYRASKCPCDLTGEPGADVTDLLAFVHNWTEGSLAADVNFDGAVDNFDLHEFLDCWHAQDGACAAQNGPGRGPPNGHPRRKR